MGGLRSTTVAGAVAMLVLAVALDASALPQTEAQQRCLNGLNRAGARVTFAAARQLERCLARAARGDLGAGQDADACLASDPGGRIARAKSKTEDIAVRKCANLPSFGAMTAAAVNDAYDNLPAAVSLFGPTLAAAIIDVDTDRAAVRCQKAGARVAARALKVRLASFNRCLKVRLADASIASAPGIELCAARDYDGRITDSDARAQNILRAECTGVDTAAAFPGACAGQPVDSLMRCVGAHLTCDGCVGINTANGVAAECDTYTDGVVIEPRCSTPTASSWSVARTWDEQLLAAIRRDLPRPPVHARNLFHTSVAMYDAWAAYDTVATPYLVDESPAPSLNIEADRAVAISFAARSVLKHRFAKAVGAATTLLSIDKAMRQLGYDPDYTSTEGGLPAAVGNRIAAAVIAYGLADGSNEAGNYSDATYTPVNDPLIVRLDGTTMNDPNRWQPLALAYSITQNNIPLPSGIQIYVGSGWSPTRGFALTGSPPYHDPGDPPYITPPSCSGPTDADFKADALEIIRLSSRLDPDAGVVIDVSPGAIFNNSLGANDGTGYPVNPCTGQPYAPNLVNQADYGRVIAEFWADGPDSETPPGHWNVIANYVSDHPLLSKRIGGVGPVVNDLEWDVKLYFAVNAAVHDAAVTSWSIKRAYDYVRPISMIRYMGGLGQSSDPMGPSYDPCGLPLEPGLVEVVTSATTAPGERHEHLAGQEGEIAIHTWPGEPADPAHEYSGADWILATGWIPYQRKTFVTPPFAAYTSGHSTFSRAAAEVLTGFTGDSYYPGCFAEYVMPANAFLTFEQGPTSDVHLQWARYYDSSDEAARSRLWGGIHVRADDLNGRITGSQVGIAVSALAQQYFDGTVVP